MKVYSFILLLFLSALPAAAQHPMDSLFVAVPDSVLPLLPLNARLDMLDYHAAAMRAQGENLLEGKSEILALSDHHIRLRLSVVHEMEILLCRNAEGAPRIVVLSTITAQFRRTRTRIYNMEWALVADKSLAPPTWPQLLSGRWPADVPESDAVCARWDEARRAVVYTLSQEGFTHEQRESLKPLLREYLLKIPHSL